MAFYGFYFDHRFFKTSGDLIIRLKWVSIWKVKNKTCLCLFICRCSGIFHLSNEMFQCIFCQNLKGKLIDKQFNSVMKTHPSFDVHRTGIWVINTLNGSPNHTLVSSGSFTHQLGCTVVAACLFDFIDLTTGEKSITVDVSGI